MFDMTLTKLSRSNVANLHKTSLIAKEMFHMRLDGLISFAIAQNTG